MSKMMMIMIKYSDFQIIMIFFTSSESLDSEKRNVEKKLVFSEKIMSFSLSAVSVFLMKNSFLTDSSTFHFLVFFITSVIQFFVFLKALFSDFSKSVFSVFLFFCS